MARVVLVGFDPAAVDFSNPALPTGMNAEKVNAGIALAMKEMRDGKPMPVSSIPMRQLGRQWNVT